MPVLFIALESRGVTVVGRLVAARERVLYRLGDKGTLVLEYKLVLILKDIDLS